MPLLKFAFFNRIYLVVLILLAIIFIWFFDENNIDIFNKFNSLWQGFKTEIKSNNTSTIFNVVSLVFIIGLSIANVVIEWKGSLPKYLSVKFECDDKEYPLLANNYALLISEADIRSLAQQIGQQKNNNERLGLDSTRYFFEKKLSYDRNGVIPASPAKHTPFWHYIVTISLTQPPASSKTFLSEQEYLSAINHNLAELLKMKEIDYETQFVKELRAALAEFKNTQS